jgi:hypothetical protein
VGEGASNTLTPFLRLSNVGLQDLALSIPAHLYDLTFREGPHVPELESLTCGEHVLDHIWPQKLDRHHYTLTGSDRTGLLEKQETIKQFTLESKGATEMTIGGRFLLTSFGGRIETNINDDVGLDGCHFVSLVRGGVAPSPCPLPRWGRGILWKSGYLNLTPSR